jgi:hypothetical protein
LAAKYLCYAIAILIVIFCLELFEVVDVPFFDLPDFLTEKDGLIKKTTDGLDEIPY